MYFVSEADLFAEGRFFMRPPAFRHLYFVGEWDIGPYWQSALPGCRINFVNILAYRPHGRMCPARFACVSEGGIVELLDSRGAAFTSRCLHERPRSSLVGVAPSEVAARCPFFAPASTKVVHGSVLSHELEHRFQGVFGDEV